MTPDFEKPRRGVTLGKGWGIALFPVVVSAMLLGAPLSLLYSIIGRHLRRRRIRALEQEMKSAGRLIAFADFTHEMDQGHGRLIVERSSFKGPVHAWWTPDKTYRLCPYPAVDWLTMMKDETFQPVSQWYRDRYTDLRTGGARLVERGQGGADFWKKLYTTGFDSGTWVEIAPVEKFEGRKRHASEG